MLAEGPAVRAVDLQREVAVGEGGQADPVATLTLADGQRYILVVEAVLAHVPERRWVNHPARNATASRKPEQLTRAKALGLTVLPTIVTQDPGALRRFWEVRAGTGAEESLAGAGEHGRWGESVR